MNCRSGAIEIESAASTIIQGGVKQWSPRDCRLAITDHSLC